MLEILKDYYHVDICRRTLNYHLRDLENDKYIKRIKRHSRGLEGQIQFATSITSLLKPALKALAKIAHWFKTVRWKVRVPVSENLSFRRDDFHHMMNENYRRHVFSSS